MNRRKTSFRAVLFLLFFFVSFVAVPVGADVSIEKLRETSKAFTGVAKKVIPAVVSVQVTKSIEVGSRSPFGYGSPFSDDFFERFFGPGYRDRSPRKYKQRGQSSGFIISSDGYILTNNHVVGGADEITVVLNDGRKLEAEIVGTDPKTDIAVIKVDAEGLSTIELGDSDALEIGEWVIAVGNPFGLSETVTVGVVSAKGRQVQAAEDVYEDFIQTDAAINPGNSGGPLLNLDGEAIGINTMIISESGGYMGIGLAIPINMAKTVKDQLISSGKVTRGYVGVTMTDVNQEIKEFFKLKSQDGVLVTDVLENSPAEEGGLQRDDVILKINGRDVKDGQAVKNVIGFTAPGTEVTFTVDRNGKEKEITVQIGNKPEASDMISKLGIEIQEMDRESAQRFGYTEGEGVLVIKVEQDSAADRAEIGPGMAILRVNRTYVNSVEDFNEALVESGDSKKILLLVRDEHFAQYVVLRLD
jgi:serine protease Do